MSRALTRVYAKAQEIQREAEATERVHDVVLPRHVVRHGVARRAAGGGAENGRPIVILAPVPDTDETVHQFALEQFPVKAQRLAR
jgi:hypothetical protein